MHVARVVGRYTAKSGEHREYVSHLLRRTFRADGKVRHETLANLSPLPAAAIEAVRASLAGKTLLVAGEDLEVTRSLPHGHVARVCRPGSKLATTRWWTDTTLAADLGLTEVSGQGGVGPPAGGGQLRTGPADPRDDQRHRHVALPADRTP